MHIARRFLLPKQLKTNGLDASHITITEPALLHIATCCTREAGMRSLERAIGGVVRYKAVEWAEHLDALASQEGSNTGTSDAIQRGEYDQVVEEHQLEKILGVAWWDGEKEREERRGIVYGLVVMGQSEGWNSAGRDDRAFWDRSFEIDGQVG
jgi:ATP-dependent Lon protease